MIRLAKVVDLVRLALYSGYLKGERPLSLLLSAPVEAGKTETIRLFSGNNGIVYETDFTPTGFIRRYTQELKTGGIKHIIVPDLLNTLAKHYYSREKLITFLNSLTEEGIASVHTLFANLDVRSPHPIGLIGGITKDMLVDSKVQWIKIGFLSRLLPVTWKYSGTTVREIMLYIVTRAYTREAQQTCAFPQSEVEVQLPVPLAMALEPLAALLLAQYRQTTALPDEVYGFRYQRHFQRLAMASALERGRDIVTQEDVDRVADLSEHCNLEFKAV